MMHSNVNLSDGNWDQGAAGLGSSGGIHVNKD